MINYPNKIKQLRLKMMLSQQEFAQELNVSYVTVNRWENGKQEPTYKTKRQLNELFMKNNMEEKETQ